jgi:hypothetical protein
MGMKRIVVTLIGLAVIVFVAYIVLKPRMAEKNFKEGLQLLDSAKYDLPLKNLIMLLSYILNATSITIKEGLPLQP